MSQQTDEEAEAEWGNAKRDGGAEPDGAEPSTFLPVYPVCVPADRWRIRGEEDIQEKLLHPCCPAEGSIDQSNPASMLEYWVYLDDQNNMADCPVTRTITPPTSPVTGRPRLFIPGPSSSVVSPMVSSPVTDTCSPSSSVPSPTTSAWDAPACSDRDPVTAAAHLHLLGESLSLIGRHLQETDKMVSVPGSLSLLLDSLLCALAPLICLTAEIPELRSCTQHTLSSTLENISYMMPGM